MSSYRIPSLYTTFKKLLERDVNLRDEYVRVLFNNTDDYPQWRENLFGTALADFYNKNPNFTGNEADALRMILERALKRT